MQRETKSAESIVSVQGLSKTYKSGFHALKRIDLEIRRGEIFALLGPNGAGKTTLISIICGIVKPSEGTVLADGHDIVRDYRAARAKIGLVPQELSTDAFEIGLGDASPSAAACSASAPNPAHLEKVLRALSLWDKKDSQDHGALRRHEAARADRQGALARARDPVPRRAHRRRRRRAAPRHVGDGPRAPRERRRRSS